jgi:predicted RNA-binding protein
MCELKVLLQGKTVFNDAIYAKADNSKVIVRDVIGNSKTFENCKIAEVDISSERLVLSTI